MGAQSVLYINDYDTALLGLVVEKVTGADDAASVQPVTRAVYGRAGEMQIALNPRVPPRTIRVAGTVQGATHAAMLANLDALKALCPAQVDVRLLRPADRFWRCILRDLALTPLDGPQYLTAAIGVGFEFLALDPLGYGLGITTASIGASPLPLSLGTAPSTPLLVVMGAATNPVVTLRNAAGAVVQTLGFTVTLGATERLEVDCAAMTITKYTGASPADALSTLASGDFLVLDPADGVPTVEVNSGTGELLYRKAWR